MGWPYRRRSQITSPYLFLFSFISASTRSAEPQLVPPSNDNFYLTGPPDGSSNHDPERIRFVHLCNSGKSWHIHSAVLAYKWVVGGCIHDEAGGRGRALDSSDSQLGLLVNTCECGNGNFGFRTVPRFVVVFFSSSSSSSSSSSREACSTGFVT